MLKEKKTKQTTTKTTTTKSTTITKKYNNNKKLPSRNHSINTQIKHFSNLKIGWNPPVMLWIDSLYESVPFPDTCFILPTFNYTGSYLDWMNVYAYESLLQWDICSESTVRWIMIAVTYSKQKIQLSICILTSLITASQELLILYLYLKEPYSSDNLIWRLFSWKTSCLT